MKILARIYKDSSYRKAATKRKVDSTIKDGVELYDLDTELEKALQEYCHTDIHVELYLSQ